MFYHKDILSRKSGGLGVIWLAATLGSRSNLKKVTKKDILNVKIPNVCEFLAAPPEPMALRLSSTLMVGVTRIYNQQCSFYMADVNHAYGKLRNEISIISGTIDMPVDKARRDTITIANDPLLVDTGDFHLPAPPSLEEGNLEQETVSNNSAMSPAISINTMQSSDPRISLPEHDSILRERQSSVNSYSYGNPIFDKRTDNLFSSVNELPLDWEIADNGEIMTREFPHRDRPNKRRLEAVIDEGEIEFVNSGPITVREGMIGIPTELVPDAGESVRPSIRRRIKEKFDSKTELTNDELKSMRFEYINLMTESRKKKDERNKDQMMKQFANQLWTGSESELFLDSTNIVAQALIDLQNAARLVDAVDLDIMMIREDPKVKESHDKQKSLVEKSMNVDVEQARRAMSIDRSSSHMPWNQLSDIGFIPTDRGSSPVDQRGRSGSFTFENIDIRGGSRNPSSHHSSIFFPSPRVGSDASDFIGALDDMNIKHGVIINNNLERDSLNFLQFVKMRIIEREGDGIEDIDSINFSELMPSRLTSRVVAAQAFQHILGLASTGLVEVSEEKAFGKIRISVDNW